ncbi:hypothetical protein HETIRDRAFT_425699 [Heterobasidion irregulare TC 32-1]|uniref:5'-3' exoribonuclease n=1 Tax=Heterobasidion irregulare (strain TC 32-1) TaxID=747525 RepID=W4KGV2_HETIT|nr:uncharacterized protein HETIRDRAFT_425699 [Heterobasidion irregulare TC 32-1]ETW84271.1 hypothetical protein HETIRDRAFT_425699 [Heterobasidion irregulare TC 32-1]
MGVPALFRWLSKKYPKIVTPVVEEDETKVEGGDGDEIIIPVNIALPNPNNVEFDNLYLDMNAIVHPCTHPEGKPAPETEEEMMLEVFKYTERVVNMIRPRKLLVMAIDGVAPRAKMNQQRSRRFRSAQEAKEKEEARRESLALWEAMGKTVSEEERNKKAWDSNAITPGTPFMDLLTSSLRYWVVQKANTDPGWKQLEVIISDASVPGEGEHKIMDYVRRQRSNPGHDPNTQHVIYGLDADLIMLALATHEPHFKVLREDVFAQSGSSTACRMCGQEGHYAAQCEERQNQNAKRRKVDMNGSSGPSPSIQLTSNPRSAPVANNFAAKADSIGLGGPKTEQAISSERTAAQALAGSNRDVVANRAAIRMANLSAAEMLKAEMASLMPVKRHALPPKPPVVVPTPTPVVEPVAVVPSTNDTSDMEVPGLGSGNFNGDAPSTGKSDSAQSIQTRQSDTESRNGNGASAMEIDKRTEVAGVKRSFEEAEEDLAEDSIGEEEEDEDAPAKPLALKVNPDGTVEQEDTVRLWESGYRERYYRQKFGVEPTDAEFKKRITTSYVEGLAWVLRYYYQGTPSWQWYYPFHFAPFAADFEEIDKMNVEFAEGQPFKPFEQLMSVFPAARYEHLDFVCSTSFPVPLDVKASKGMSGSVLPNPDCIPGSTYYSPLSSQGLPDIRNDRTLSVLYFFPKQLTPHRSVLLPGVRRPPRALTADDLENTRRRGQGRGGRDFGGHASTFAGQTFYGSMSHNNGRMQNQGGYNRPPQSYQQDSANSSWQPQYPPPQNNYGGYNRQPPPSSSYNAGGYSGGRGGRPSRGGYGGPQSHARGYSPSGPSPGRGGHAAPAYNGPRGGGNAGGAAYTGGYGGYGDQQSPQSNGYRGGYGGHNRGGSNNAPRGRGRGGWY